MKKLLLLITLIFSTILSAQPTITSFAPTSGPIGTSVTITGTNFDTTPANNIVFFGATQATVSVATATELTVTVPTGATYMPITVLVNGLLAYSSAPFVVTFDGGGINSNSFATKVDFTTGSNPASVSIGDLDGDGKVDLAVANQNSNTVSVFRNISASGTIDATSFATKVDYQTGAFPQIVIIGDVDGDGKPELIVANILSNTVSVFRNTSTSGTIDATSFAVKVDYTTNAYPGRVSMGDLDADGKVDLVVTSGNTNTVSVFRNTSTSGTIDATSFATKVDYTTGAIPSSVSMGDLDADGKIDLVVGNSNSSTVSVLRNTSTSGIIDATSFAPKVDYATESTGSVSIGDLDGDGKADLAVVNGGSSVVSVLRNTSTSGIIDATSFAIKVDYTTGSSPQSISIGDIDGDGKVDLAVGNIVSNTISVFRNTSTSGTIDATSFATKVDYATESSPQKVSIGDLDGDGKADLTVANFGNNTVSVLRNEIVLPPPPTLTSFTPISGPIGTLVTITGTNFDATPANNIVFFGATQATVSAATATELTVTVPSGATYMPITVLVNELVAYSATPFVATFGGTGIDASSLASKVDLVTLSGGFSVSFGDLDLDGKPDIVMANLFNSSISVFRNTSSSGTIDAGSFEAKVDYATGSFPIAVSIGDLDGDGKLDLAVANSSDNTVSVFRNTSTSGTIDASSFATKVDFTAGASPQSVSIGDLDGDGKADLAVGNFSGNTVSVFRNTGTSGTIDGNSFSPKVDFITGADPSSVSIADLDGDGKSDLAISNRSSNTASVFRNTSTIGIINASSFATKVDYSTEISPIAISVGDLDGDGKVDLAVVNSNAVSILRNTSTSGIIDATSFASKIDFAAGVGAYSVSLGDLNGDGKLDLAVPNSSDNTVSILRNTSTNGTIDAGSFAAKVDFATDQTPRSAFIGDLDGDGKADLVVTNASSSSLSVFKNVIVSPSAITSFAPSSGPIGTTVTITGTNFDTTPANNIAFFGATQATVTAATTTELTVTVPTGATYMPITVLVNELIAYSSTPFVVTFDGSALDTDSFDAKVDYTTGSNPHFISIGDLDGDGKADLAVANQSSSSVSVFRNISTSGTVDATSFATKVDYTTGANPFSVSIGDLDGDGKADLTVENFTSNTVSVFRNTSTSGTIDATSFATKVDYTTGSGPTSVSLGDLDGDGKVDLAVANTLSNTVSVFRNTSTSGIIDASSFGTKVDYTTSSAPISISIGDLDEDGKADLAVSNRVSNTVSVFRNTSAHGTIDATSFATRVDYTTGTEPRSVSIGDLDGDGKADLAVANLNSSTVSVFRNTSTSGTIDATSFATKLDYTTGINPRSVSIGDLDGDGKVDLVLVNAINNATVSVFRNTSTSGTIDVNSFATEVDYTTGTGPFSVSIGDLDGDGQADLAVANFNSHTISVLKNIILPPSTETDITAFSFTEQTGAATIDAGNHSVDIEVDFDTDVSTLVSTFTLSTGANAEVIAIDQISATTANDFTSPVTYTVTAEDGVTTQDWVVTVTEALNTETDITAFSLAEQTGAAAIDAGNHTVVIEVVFGTDLTTLVSTFTLSTGANAEVSATAQTSTTTSNDFTNPVTYTITAEDGVTTQDWVVTVTEAPNTETDITAFSFTEQSGIAAIDAGNHTVGIEVVFGTNVVFLVSTFTLSTGANAEVSAAAQTSATSSNDFTNPVTYTITAEDGVTTQDWVVTVIEEPNTETDITAFSFTEQSGTAAIDAGNHTVGIEVVFGTDVASLVSTFTLSTGANAEVSAAAQTSATTSNDFTNSVTYTITAEDGITTQDWVVTVSEAPNTETDFTAFSLAEQTGAAAIDVGNHTVAAEVVFGTDVASLVSTFTLSTGANAEVSAAAQTSATTSNDFTNSVTYTITAEDGITTQDWVVTVSEAPNTETDFTAFSLAEQTGAAAIDVGNHTVAAEVVFGTDVASLVSTFTLSTNANAEVSATAQTSTTTSNDFTNSVTYTITAEDGITTQDWVVTVSEAPNTETDFTAFSLAEQTGAAAIDLGDHTVTVEVVFGTDLTTLVSTFTLSTNANAEVSATAQTSATTSNDFTNSVTYTITAEDGITTQDWVVTVSEAPNTETDFTAFSLAEQTGAAAIDVGNHTVAAEVVFGTNLTNLVSTFTLSTNANAEVSATAQTSATTSNDFTNPVAYTITAEDGITSQDWVVTVSEAPNTETDFTAFSLAEQTGAAAIDVGNHTVAVEVVFGTDLTTLVSTFTLSTGASAMVGAAAQTSATTSNDFTNPVAYTITAEDGITTQDWVVTVFEAPNTETDFTAFSLVEQTGAAAIDLGDHTVAVEVVFGTVLTTLVSTFGLSNGASAELGSITQVSGTTVNDFMSSVVYTIIAEDGIISQDWIVSVEVEDNDPVFVSLDVISFAENGTGNVIDINATNGDGGAVDAGITYSLAGEDSNDFGIDGASGVLTFVSSPDFESPTDADLDNEYLVSVTANDGVKSTIQTITITVTDVDENQAPTISDQTFGIDENSANETVVGTVIASDSNGDNLTFSSEINNDNDHPFALNVLGELTVKETSVLDFETITFWVFSVTVDDGNGGQSAATLTINVNDVDEKVLSLKDQTGLIKIYPNPTQQFLYIDSDKILTVHIFSLDGKMNLRSKASKDEPLDLQSLSQGQYLIQLLDESHVIYSGKIIKAN